MKKQLLMVGDRVLIAPEENNEKTNAGLYLPQGVHEKEKIQTGYIVKIGPGYPIPDTASLEDEPWQAPANRNKYFPLQAQENDFCIFLRNSAIEIEFEEKKYVVVPHAAILVILRNSPDDKT